MGVLGLDFALRLILYGSERRARVKAYAETRNLNTLIVSSRRARGVLRALAMDADVTRTLVENTSHFILDVLERPYWKECLILSVTGGKGFYRQVLKCWIGRMPQVTFSRMSKLKTRRFYS